MRLAPAQRLARVEFEEIYRFGGIGIGFGPTFARLVDHPGGELIDTAAQDRRRLDQDAGALLDRNLRPVAKRLGRGAHGAVGQFRRRIAYAADDLCGTRRVAADGFLRRRDALPTDDEGVCLSQLAADCRQRRLHPAARRFFGKIDVRFVLKRCQHGRTSLCCLSYLDYTGLYRTVVFRAGQPVSLAMLTLFLLISGLTASTLTPNPSPCKGEGRA